MESGHTDEHLIVGNLPLPYPPSNSKDWHSSITTELRSRSIGKFVRAIFPGFDPAAMRDQRVVDLITYARHVEKEMFEYANDKEEYHLLLAEKIYKIQEEIRAKQKRRIGEQKETNETMFL